MMHKQQNLMDKKNSHGKEVKHHDLSSFNALKESNNNQEKKKKMAACYLLFSLKKKLIFLNINI